MSQFEQSAKLAEEINAVLSAVKDEDEFYRLIKTPLLNSRRGLADDAPEDKPWILLPVMVCESLCGDGDRAIPAAAAIQFMLAAGDVFDDIEDSDSPN